ncbi:MAG: hypothetical protein V1814_02340 [Candidatus Moraniibacteriota bacterium]
MLYEPPKKEKYILIGASVFLSAIILVVAVPLLYKKYKPGDSSANPTPIMSSEQQGIQKEFEKLKAMRKSINAKQPTQEEIQKEFDALENQRKESGTAPPTQEQIQAEFNKLERIK